MQTQRRREQDENIRPDLGRKKMKLTRLGVWHLEAEV